MQHVLSALSPETEVPIAPPPPVDESFTATLPPRERRLASRLEGFGDIVFGFAVSQCALQLPTAHGHVDLAHPIALLLYFGTFALLTTLWLTYHRLMSGPYKPTRVDLFLTFGYLALVSLMPYAMYSVSHETESLASATAAVAEYSILFAFMMGFAAILTFRNLRRGWWTINDEDRELIWNAFLRRCVLCVMMIIAFTVNFVLGPKASAIPFFGIFVTARLVRLCARKAPPAAVLRMNKSR